MHKYSFEKLQVWQKARILNKESYQITKSFTETEGFGLSNQLRRASVSISSNIAEGSGRSTLKDQSHFYTIASGSLMEVLSQLYLAVDIELLSEDKLTKDLRPQIESISRPLYGLMNRK